MPNSPDEGASHAEGRACRCGAGRRWGPRRLLRTGRSVEFLRSNGRAGLSDAIAPRTVPLLLVDVDGVLSLYGGARAEPGTLLATLVDGIPHLLSRRAAAVLLELAKAFECVWCTGWEDRADSHLPALLGLPRGWPHIHFPQVAEPAAHWKLAGIDAYAGPDRPLAWIDDAHDAACRDWAAARPGPTLLVTTEPDLGLTADHAAFLRGWST
jgi:hypothetical protein